MPKGPPIPPKSEKTVAILTFPALQLLDVTGPLQVFSAANEHLQRQGDEAPYHLLVVAPGGGSMRSTAGLELITQPLPDGDTPIDTLIVAGGQGVLAAENDDDLLHWVAQRAASARRVASVCTGAFLLGAAHVLDGRRAVTHWAYCRRLAERYPAIEVDPDPIFLRDGPVWTSAGITAGIDLALALVEEDLGREVALAVSRELVVFLKRPGGQAQFSAALSFQSTDATFAALHDWMRDNLGGELSVHRLARQAAMSDRTFLRRYKEEVGLTPGRAVERLRTEAARQLLASTRLSSKQIADRCGFGSEESMRRAFQRLQSISPQEYRARFRI